MNANRTGTPTASKCGELVFAASLLCAGAGFVTSATVVADGEPPALVESGSVDKIITFEGRIERMELEGGFWGVVTDDGQRLDPGSLPQSVQVEGLRVQGRAQPLTDIMTIRMWGTPVKLLEIKPVP